MSRKARWVFYKMLDQCPSVCAAETEDFAVGMLIYILSSFLPSFCLFIYVRVRICACLLAPFCSFRAFSFSSLSLRSLTFLFSLRLLLLFLYLFEVYRDERLTQYYASYSISLMLWCSDAPSLQNWALCFLLLSSAKNPFRKSGVIVWSEVLTMLSRIFMPPGVLIRIAL
jgi:hypothetical protein